MAADPRAPRRPPPSFMEYASDMLASEKVREMSLEELGLLAAMRWACWHNGDIPREPERIARLIGKDPADVKRALTEEVMGFFEPTARTPSRLHAPELTHQRKRMFERATQRTKIGKKGANARWGKGNGDASGNASGNASLKGNELIGRKGFTPGSTEDDIPF